MSEPWKSDMGEKDEFERLFGERDESWRGELHLVDDEDWRSSESSWDIDDEIWSDDDADDWMTQDEAEDSWTSQDRDDEAA